MLSMAPQRTLRMSTLAELAEGSLPRLSRWSGGWKSAAGYAVPPTPKTAGTPWRFLPIKAGPRSPGPPPGMSRRSAAWYSTRSPRPRSGSCVTSAAASCVPSTLTIPASPTSHLPPRLSATYLGQPPGPRPPLHRRDRQHPQPEGCRPGSSGTRLVQGPCGLESGGSMRGRIRASRTAAIFAAAEGPGDPGYLVVNVVLRVALSAGCGAPTLAAISVRLSFRSGFPRRSAKISPCCWERRMGKSAGAGRLSTIRRIFFNLRIVGLACLAPVEDGCPCCAKRPRSQIRRTPSHLRNPSR